MKQAPHLSFKEKIGYALGDAASNFFFQFFSLFLVFYYTDSLGISATAAGTMMLVTRLADAVIDPMVGAVADRTRTRWGRFRPYLLWFAIPYGLTGVLMFMCPNWSSAGKLAFAYVTYTLMMFIYSAINVPYSALMGVMSDSSLERTRLSSYRFVAAFGAGMLIASLALPLKNYFGGGNDKVGFLWTMTIFAVLSVICFLITFQTTRERVRPVQDDSKKIGEDVKLLIESLPWVLLFIISLFNLTWFCGRSGAQIYYFKYVVGDETRAQWFITAGMIATMAGIALAPWFARRLGKRRAMIILSLITTVLNVSFFILPTKGQTLLITINILSGFFSGPTGAIVWSMYADAADEIEWKHGRRITGLVYAGVLFSMKMGIALGGALIGWVLAGFGFIPNIVQSPHTLLGIKIAFSLLPAGISVIPIVCLFFYPLTDERLVEIEGELASRRTKSSRESSTDIQEVEMTGNPGLSTQ